MLSSKGTSKKYKYDYRKDGKIDITQIWPLARLGYYDYTSVTDVFEMRIPGASGEAAAGLEGRASNTD